MPKGVVNKIKKMSKIEIGESPNPIVGILETCPPLAENSFVTISTNLSLRFWPFSFVINVKSEFLAISFFIVLFFAL